MMTDPIADMLTRIRNANSQKHDSVDIPKSRIKQEIELKYLPNKERVMSGIKRISKPGLRIYVNSNEVPKVLGGLGIAILSTSHGLMTDKKARQDKVGGEVICYVW